MLTPLCEKLWENQIFTLSKVSSHKSLINYKGEKAPLYWRDQADAALPNWSNSVSPVNGTNRHHVTPYVMLRGAHTINSSCQKCEETIRYIQAMAEPIGQLALELAENTNADYRSKENQR